MVLLLVSFIAGVLTILAPCVLPVLPIVVGGSLSGERKRNPIIITATLAVSIVLFTLLLKASTVFINIPQSVWSYISGAIIIFLGLLELFPALWSTISARFGFGNRSDQLLAKSSEKKTWVGDVFIGASLVGLFGLFTRLFFPLASVCR